jgi:hypothetical protein
VNAVPNQEVHIILLCKNMKYSFKLQYNDVFVGSIIFNISEKYSYNRAVHRFEKKQ